jgi:hypothetical protein
MLFMSSNNPEQFTLEQHEQMFGFWTEARATYDSATDKDANFEVLKSVPGIDPVLAVVDGHPEDIPQDGYVVNSHIAPGYGGVVNIYRYKDGGLVPGSASDTREQYGQARVHFDLKGFGRHTVAYENPAFPQKDVEPFNRMSQASYTGLPFSETEIIDLDNGGRILDEKDPMTMYEGSSQFFSMDWDDIDRHPDIRREVDINRVTSDPEQLRQILAHLSYAMGMSQQGMETLVTTVDQKVSPIA